MATELAKAYVQIVPSAQGIKGSISNVLGGESKSAGKKSGESIGSSMVSTLKKVVVAAGIGKMVQTAFSEGASLEQSIGGIETLYKDSSEKMIGYADEAFKTAGISANEYMEIATSFSAGLISSMGGNTAKAASAANQAIIDMSDNANKMGTDMESIQNAYQGFAKQNYTMLDNLKLGYGGTKQEMERLLKDAGKITGQKYNLDNLGDVYEAIHVIQTELDITGTTSKEAATTISGSLASMKAAASNVLANLVTGRDVTEPLAALMETASTFLGDNILPAAQNIINAMPTVINSICNAIIANLPALVQMGVQLLVSLTVGLTQAIPKLIEKIPLIIKVFINELKKAWPDIKKAGGDMITGLWNGISDKVAWIKEKIKGFGQSVLNSIKEVFKIGSPSKLMRDEVGKWIPAGIAVGIEQNTNTVSKAMQGVANAAVGRVNGTIAGSIRSNTAISRNANIGGNNDDVYELLANTLPQLANGQNVNITLQGGAEGIFRVVRKQNEVFRKSTGMNAFA